jgi:hypothetical protein
MAHKLLSIGVIFLCMLPSCLLGQDQKIADSVKLIYQQDTLEDIAKLELLTELSFNEIRDLKKALFYAHELIDLAEEKGDIKSAELAKELNSVTKEGE